MKRYNRDARASLKNNTRMKARATHTQAQPHAPRYDGYNHTVYMPIITRTTHARTPSKYVKLVNAMNAVNAIITDTTPTLTHLPTAPYRKFMLTPTDNPLTRPEPQTPTPITDTKTVKAVIYDHTGTRRIWYGCIRRTRTITQTSIHITLHRNTRTLTVKPYTPPRDMMPYTHAELAKYQVEIYKMP